MVLHARALCPLAALRARRLAPEVLAVLLVVAFTVALALVAASGQRAAGEADQARARGHTVDHFAFCVLSARTGVAQFL